MFIGIDPGRNTGFAMATNRKFQCVETVRIHRAMKIVEKLLNNAETATIVVEDARLRGCSYRGAARAQGAGSVKRDCVIWQDFLSDYENESPEDLELNVLFVTPGKSATKVPAKEFKMLTGWKHRTSEHARDAAMLIYDLAQIIQSKR